ncbi:MAG: SLC13 family permease [Planctomycetaceae bacterium]
MDLATLSLLALAAIVLLSCVTRVNIGLLALSLAWVIGTYVAPRYGYDYDARTVAGFFPVDLFVKLAGVTLLFSIAQRNGTLQLVTTTGLRACRGKNALVPFMFFILACGLSASGAGNIPSVALLASSAMLAGRQAGISPLVMTLMVAHGSIAGNLSPLTPMGIIAEKNLAELGLVGYSGYTFGMNFAANALVALLGYVLFRGWRLAPPDASSEIDAATSSPVSPASTDDNTALDAPRAFTLVLLALLIVGVIRFGVDIGFAGFAASALLVVTGCGDDRAAIRDMPWSVILMVCGVTVLVALCEKTGGLDLFSALIARVATAETISAWMAGSTGLISVFSSTSGVVMPTFLPTVAGVAERVGSDDLLGIATSVNIGSNLVDVSSLSTLGALCVAAVPNEAARRKLFRQALVWGLSMSLVAAALCWAVF